MELHAVGIISETRHGLCRILQTRWACSVDLQNIDTPFSKLITDNLSFYSIVKWCLESSNNEIALQHLKILLLYIPF